MKNWPALIVAPSLALATQSATYALVTPSCSLQTTVALHAVFLVSLVLTLIFTALALVNWRRAARGRYVSDAVDNRGHFLAQVATLVGAFSAIVIVAMWWSQWIVSPCQS